MLQPQKKRRVSQKVNDVVLWRIYYADGSIFDSTMGEPEDAPGHGIVAVVDRNEQLGRVVLSGWDWMYYDGAEWYGADLHGMLDRLLHRLTTRAVLQGRMVNQSQWEDIMDRAVTDPDFPIRSKGILARERPFQKIGW